MENLFKGRLAKNIKKNVQYLTLVFNDFFVLALIFLLGAFLFWYTQALQTMPSNLWFYKPLIAILLFLPLLFGKLATLLEKADSQFIWTQDVQILDYLKKARTYSMTFPSIIIILVAGLVYPFAVTKTGLTPLSYLAITLSLFFMKATEFNVTIKSFYDGSNISRTIMSFRAFTLVLLLVGVNDFKINILPLGALLISILFFALTLKIKPALFDWLDAIEFEQKRQEVVLGFYSLFTDVKNRPIKIKRRKYLDGLLTKDLTKVSATKYLFERSMLRNPESLNLFTRMTAFAILVAVMVQDANWVLGLDLLVVFLTVYQMLPLYQQYENNMMYQILPINPAEKNKSFTQIMQVILLLQWLLISVSWLLFLPEKIKLAGFAIILFIAVIIMVRGYVPSKLKQMDKPNKKKKIRKR